MANTRSLLNSTTPELMFSRKDITPLSTSSDYISTKGQLISKCLLGVIVVTNIATKI